MNHLSFACLIAALVVFALATLNVPARPNLTALGLFFVTLAAVLGRYVLLFGVVLALSGCATRQLSTVGLSKDQIRLEEARLVDAREVRKERWWAFAETVGKAGVNVGVTWLQSWLKQGSDDGLSKDR